MVEMEVKIQAPEPAVKTFTLMFQLGLLLKMMNQTSKFLKLQKIIKNLFCLRVDLVVEEMYTSKMQFDKALGMLSLVYQELSLVRF